MQDLEELLEIYKKGKTYGLTIDEFNKGVELVQKAIKRLAICKKCEALKECNNDFLNCKIIKKRLQKTILNYIEG